MTDTPLPPKRPYLLRAMHQWMTDGGQTPHVIVDVQERGSEQLHPQLFDLVDDLELQLVVARECLGSFLQRQKLFSPEIDLVISRGR